MRFLLAALMAFLLAVASYATAFAQGGPVTQSGGVTRGHPPMWSTNGVLGDAGGAAAGAIKELGIGNSGLPFCINDQSATPLGNGAWGPPSVPYHQFCLGTAVDGTGLITFNPVGGATLSGLNYQINGSLYGVPGVGGGNVTGPNSSTVGEIVSFNGTVPPTAIRQGPAHLTDAQTGALINDGAGLGTFSKTGLSALSIYQMATNASGLANYDVNRSVLRIPSGSLVTNATGYASYIENQNPLGSGVNTGSGVNFFSVGAATANGAASWGINTVLTDNTSFVVSSGTGRVLQNEYDYNVTSPNTTVHGLFVTGASLAQMDIATSDGFSCRTGNGGWAWPTCFHSSSGTALNAFVAGAAAASGTNVPSQYTLYAFWDGASAPGAYNMRVNNLGAFEVASTLGAATQFQVDGLFRTPDSATGNNNAFVAGALASSGINIGSQTILWHWFNGAGTSLLAEAAVSPSGILTFAGAAGYAFGGGPVTIGAGIGISGVASLSGVTGGGTATKYVCTDASGNIVVQVGAC